jgi:O-antigen/teichoic acid export membrane protein
MSTIRRQSILSSIVIYIGFGVGMLNTFFFLKPQHFSAEQYGLTSIFMAIATMMMVFAMMAMPSFIYKFYHYYNDHLPPRKNDMIMWALVVSSIGFVLVMIAGWFFKGLVIRKFGEHSPILLQYYYWIFPMGAGLTIYTVLEAYTINLGKPIFTNFLKEVVWRLLTTALILLVIMGVINDFDLFIKLYAFGFPVLALGLFSYLIFHKKIHFTFSPSKVSRRYFKKIVSLCLFVYLGTIISTLSQVFDSIVIASVLDDGMAKAGIFGLAQVLTSIIQAPQRGIVAASIPHISRAWKDKNTVMLKKIYQRSSINLLIFAMCIFFLISLNYKEAILTLNLNEKFLLGFNAFLFLGLTKIVDMGTGLNAQIIGTSNYWRFELTSGVILLVLILPLTLILTRQYDILGPAIASLISTSIYNIIRILFLWKKFRLFPFTIHSFYGAMLGVGSFCICYFLFRSMHGFGGLVIRSLAFLLLYGGGIIYLRLTPDIKPVMATLKKKMGWRPKD